MLDHNTTETLYSSRAANNIGGRRRRRKTHSPRVKVLIALVIILLCTTIVCATILGIRESTRPGPLPASEECNTIGCIKAAARVSSWLDASEPPCNDFFKFACGNWINSQVIPDEKPSVSTFSLLRDEMLGRTKRILEESFTTGDEKADRIISKMRRYYRNCLKRDEYGSSHQLLSQLFSYLPLPFINQTGWDSYGKTQFAKFLADFKMFDQDLIFSVGAYSDSRNATRYILGVDQPPLGLNAKLYYVEPRFRPIRDAYKRLMRRVLEKVYQDLNITTYTIDEEALFNLELEIANATASRSERRDLNKTDRRWTVAQLKASSNKFKWGDFLDHLTQQLDPPRKLNDSQVIMVRAEDYLRNLDSILDNNSIDNLGQLATFALVQQFQSMLNLEYRSIFADLYQVLRGTRGDDTRWKQCVSMIKDNIWSDVIARLYSQRFFDASAKTEAVEMISYVREAFYQLLTVNQWMDQDTIKVAEHKARVMKERIGYPDYILNGTYLVEEYDKIPVNDGNFFDDQIKIKFMGTKLYLKRIWELVDRNRWITSSVVVNAFYSSSLNQIYFPMGILASPFFDEDYPKYLNYGGIGAVIGHEITHGFDDAGRQKDAEGNYKPWWSESAVKNFKEAAQCIVDQYSKYKAPIKIQNITLNGAQTQGESIADNGGIKQAFEGYTQYIKKRGRPEKKLPSLPYTPEQLFFINYGQIWCSKMREKEWVSRILTGVHPPTMFRVIGTLSNNEDFQRVFGCKRTDPMNPEKKCSVW